MAPYTTFQHAPSLSASALGSARRQLNLWPPDWWHQIDGVVRSRQFSGANSEFRLLEQAITKSDEQELHVQSEHAELVWMFLVGFAEQKPTYRAKLIRVFKALSDLPEWMAAYSSQPDLVERVGSLHDDLGAALGSAGAHANPKRAGLLQVPGELSESHSPTPPLQTSSDAIARLHKHRDRIWPLLDDRRRWVRECEDAFSDLRLEVFHLRRDLQGTTGKLDAVCGKEVFYRFLCRLSRECHLLQGRCAEVLRILLESDVWLDAFDADTEVSCEDLPPGLMEDVRSRLQERGLDAGGHRGFDETALPHYAGSDSEPERGRRCAESASLLGDADPMGSPPAGRPADFEGNAPRAPTLGSDRYRSGPGPRPDAPRAWADGSQQDMRRSGSMSTRQSEGSLPGVGHYPDSHSISRHDPDGPGTGRSLVNRHSETTPGCFARTESCPVASVPGQRQNLPPRLGMPPRLPEASMRRSVDREPPQAGIGCAWGPPEDRVEDASSAVDGWHKTEPSTASTAGTPTYGMVVRSADTSAFGINGLPQVLQAAHLSGSIREAAMTWCENQGAVRLEEVVDVLDDLTDTLALRPMEKRRLEDALSGAIGSDGRPLAQRVAFRVRGSKSMPAVPLRAAASAGKTQPGKALQPILGDESSLEGYLPTLGVREVSRVIVALGAVGIETKADLERLDAPLWKELDEQLRLENITIGDRAKMKHAQRSSMARFCSCLRSS